MTETTQTAALRELVERVNDHAVHDDDCAYDCSCSCGLSAARKDVRNALAAAERRETALRALSARLRTFSESPLDWIEACPSRANVRRWADDLDAILAGGGSVA